MEKIEEIEKRSTSRQVLLCLTAYLTAIAPSMSIGFSAVSLPSLTDPNDSKSLTIYEASWVASIASIGTPIGCFLCGPLSDRYGRRTGLLLVNITSFLGWAIIALAPNSEERYAQLLCGRFLTGFSTGMISMPATVYMAETSSDKYRLWFTTASAVAFSGGILCVYVLGYIMPTSWGTVALISANIACFSMFCGIFFLPESPIWLVKHNKFTEAQNSLRRIYGKSTVTKLVENDLQILIRNKNNLNANKIDSRNDKKGIFYHVKRKYLNLSKPECKKPLIIMATYFFFQQFSGTFVIIFYAVKIVKISGSNINPYTGMLLIGITRLLSAIVTCAVSRKYGRRPPSLFSGMGMTIAMSSLALYIYINDTQTELKLSENYGFLPILCLILYFMVSTPGFVTVPFAMSAEVFPVSARGVASGLVSTMAYIFNFIVVKLFDTVLDIIGASALFAFFGLIAFLGTIFLYKYLPETKGKTMAEIEDYFRKKQDGGYTDNKYIKQNIVINYKEENVPFKV